MVPALLLVTAFLVLRGAGWLGVAVLDNWDLPLRAALALMFLVTASAHWGRGRVDLIRMVPPQFRDPARLVTFTGVLEILGAFGLLLPPTARTAALCLIVLLVVLFPANARAARERLMILGRPAMGLAARAALQAFFLAALGLVAAVPPK